MSAYMCSNATLSQLAYAIAERASTARKPADIHRALHAENCRSLEYRYPEHPCTEPLEPIAPRDRTLPLVALYGVARNFDYQACEHPEYEQSQAAQWVEQVCESIKRETGRTHRSLLDDDDCVWGL